jgi:hypothetical protein
LYFQTSVLRDFVPNLNILNTSTATDTAYSNLKPDCLVYYSDEGPPVCGDFSRADIFVEVKRVGDPFVFEKPCKTSSNDTDSVYSPASPDNLGQITAYATAILSSQYRTHTFSVLIMGDYARLIRWDRGGIVFTSSIPFLESRHLLDFFILYNEADREVRGHDPTVKPATKE